MIIRSKYYFVIILFSNNISIILKNLLNFFICIKGVKVYIKIDKNLDKNLDKNIVVISHLNIRIRKINAFYTFR